MYKSLLSTLKYPFTRYAWLQAWHSIFIAPLQVVALLHAITAKKLSSIMRHIGGVGIGLTAWFVLLLSIIAFVDGPLYPLFDAHNLDKSWGGPTLVGAWATHALIDIITIPISLWILRGLVHLNNINQPSAASTKRRWWTLPLSLILTVLSTLVFVSWLQQI